MLDPSGYYLSANARQINANTRMVDVGFIALPAFITHFSLPSPQNHTVYTFAFIYSAHPVLHPSGRAFARSKCSCTLVRAFADPCWESGGSALLDPPYTYFLSAVGWIKRSGSTVWCHQVRHIARLYLSP